MKDELPARSRRVDLLGQADELNAALFETLSNSIK